MNYSFLIVMAVFLLIAGPIVAPRRRAQGLPMNIALSIFAAVMVLASILHVVAFIRIKRSHRALLREVARAGERKGHH